jgi:hypothetical protein
MGELNPCSLVPRMSGYTSGFSPEEYDEFKQILRDLGAQQGTFDANEATGAILNKRLVERGVDQVLANVGDIVTVLKDMEDLGYIRSVPRDPPDGSARWEYVEGI